jgi:hypothetical protein
MAPLPTVPSRLISSGHPVECKGVRGSGVTLKSKRKDAELKLQGISTASGNMWDELKAGAESVLDVTKTAMDDAILKIK